MLLKSVMKKLLLCFTSAFSDKKSDEFIFTPVELKLSITLWVHYLTQIH